MSEAELAKELSFINLVAKITLLVSCINIMTVFYIALNLN